MVFSVNFTVLVSHTHTHAHARVNAGKDSRAPVSYLTGVYRVSSVPVRFCIGSVEWYQTEKKAERETDPSGPDGTFSGGNRRLGNFRIGDNRESRPRDRVLGVVNGLKQISWLVNIHDLGFLCRIPAESSLCNVSMASLIFMSICHSRICERWLVEAYRGVAF